MKTFNKKMQDYLYEYKGLDTKIKNIKIDIEALEDNANLKALNKKEKLFFNIPLVDEEEYIKNEITRLKVKLKFTQDLKDKIDNSLKLLSSEELLLIQSRYFDKNNLTWSQISNKLGTTEDYCRKLNYKIINKLIDLYFNNERV